MIANIRSSKDITIFAEQLIKEGVSFHPDDDFSDYVNLKTNEPFYTNEQIIERNELISQSFDLCEKEGLDIYAICNKAFLIQTRLDKFIPLPFLS